MLISENKQLTPEWFAERAGLPTASRFSDIVTSKGEPSKSAQKYMYTLAIEKLTGRKEDSYTNAAMERGVILEEEARGLYSLLTGSSVKTVGLCWKDDKKRFGASCDGIVGDNEGCLEIKCPSASVFCEYLLKNAVPTKYLAQIQGQMCVTGCKWADFAAYYPGARLLVVRVERDEEFIAKLDMQLRLFVAELEILTEKIR